MSLRVVVSSPSLELSGANTLSSRISSINFNAPESKPSGS